MDKNNPKSRSAFHVNEVSKIPKATTMQTAFVVFVVFLMCLVPSCGTMTPRNLGSVSNAADPNLQMKPHLDTIILLHSSTDSVTNEVKEIQETHVETNTDSVQVKVELPDVLVLQKLKWKTDTTLFPYKVAQVNSNELMRRLPEYTLVQDSILRYQNHLQEQLRIMRNYLDQEVGYFVDHKEELSPAMKYFYQAEVSQLKQLCDLYETIILQEEYAYEVMMMKPLKKKIEKVVELVAKRNGLIYVFDEAVQTATGDPFRAQILIPQVIYSNIDILPQIEIELQNMN